MLRPSVIVDLDGTLVDVKHIEHLVQGRKKYFEKFQEESTHAPPRADVVQLVEALFRAGFLLVLVSGRSENWRAPTIDWLRKAGIHYERLMMRSMGDNQSDASLKRCFMAELDETYDVCLAIDDNPQVIEVWRSFEIPVVFVPGKLNDFGRVFNAE